jgi:hypothetical protein
MTAIEFDPFRVVQLLKVDAANEPVLHKLLVDVLSTSPPLCPPWSTRKDSKGRTYFWNTSTKETQWEHPSTKTVLEPLCSFFRANIYKDSKQEIIDACQV